MAKKGSVSQKQASKVGKILREKGSTKKQKTEAAKKRNKHKEYHKQN